MRMRIRMMSAPDPFLPVLPSRPGIHDAGSTEKVASFLTPINGNVTRLSYF